MLPLLLALLVSPPHGGQYQPPESDASVPEDLAGVVAQPGLGPELVFEANRWEWWFDFNQEVLLRLRDRLERSAAAAGGPAWQPVSDDLRTSTILPVLVEAVRHDPPATGGLRRVANPRDVRAAAVLALGRLARTEAVPYIELVAENDPDLFVRTQAILALGFTASGSAVETLARLYRDEKQDAEIRSYAAAGLGLIGNAQSVDVLRTALDEKALGDQNNQLRAATLFAAGLAADPVLGTALRGLSETWLYKKEPQLRALVAVALGNILDPATVPFLLTLLEDPDNQVRRSAAVGLASAAAQLDAPAIETVIARYGVDADSAARINLLRVLGAARQPESRAWLRDELSQAGFEYRSHVALALGMDGDPGNTDVLVAALDDEHEQSTYAALVVALGLLEDDDATNTLVERLLRERAPYSRGYLCLALGLINPPRPEVAETLDRMAREEADVELVRWAVIGLGLLGDRGRLEVLATDAPELGNTIRRAAVVHGLGLVGDRTAIVPLVAIIRDPGQPAYVRTYALQALGELSDPRPLSQCGRLSTNVEMSHEVGFLFEMYRVL